MKLIPVLLVLGIMFSICGLGSKVKELSNSNNSGKSGSSGSSGEVENAKPTDAQAAAIQGGQDIKWEKQGMSFTVPASWKESENDSKMFLWRSPGGSDAANLIVSISPMDESFPTEISINAFYDGAKTRAKNGEVDELKWVAIDGLKGVQFRESNPEEADGIRRLQWMAYRKYATQVQLVNVMLSSSGKGFPKHQDEMYGVLYSMKLIH
jgi:hypothetical protein